MANVNNINIEGAMIIGRTFQEKEINSILVKEDSVL